MGKHSNLGTYLGGKKPIKAIKQGRIGEIVLKFQIVVLAPTPVKADLSINAPLFLND